jgi:acetolactate decarboxylase
MNKSLAVFYLSFFIQLSATAQIPKITGAMRNVMWKGELAGLIQIDTISNKKGLYGLGPLEYLQGEILILDGITYVSKVKEIKSMEVFVTENVKAPFFGYDNIHEWKEISLSKQVKDLKSLEKFIDQYNRSNDLPFFFKLEGKIKDANIHIVNLPAGSVVKSPDDAHQGQVNYQLKDKLVTLIGFFSRKHKAVFTHHDTFMHIHLITQDKDMMGHLEEITFLAKDFKLFIPANIGQ